MKRFTIYRNIRKKAMVMGLPIALFALIMVSVVVSMLVIIFSFSLAVIIGAMIFNIGLYMGLLNRARLSSLIQWKSRFPYIISNKKLSFLDYEN